MCIRAVRVPGARRAGRVVAVKHPDTIWTTPAPKQWKTVPMQFAVLHCVVPLIVCTFHVTIRESPAGNRQASMAQVLL